MGALVWRGPSKHISPTLRTKVEQAIAAGRSDEWIETTLAVPAVVAADVRAWLDWLNTQPDTVPQAENRAEAREEQARIYSRVQPACQQPRRIQGRWERGRLENATTRLRQRGGAA